MLTHEDVDALAERVEEEASRSSLYTNKSASWTKGIFDLLALAVKARIPPPAAKPDDRDTVGFKWVAAKNEGPAQVEVLRSLARKLGWEFAAYEQKGENHNVLYLKRS